ncbi:MAG TPA: hypothetical protein VFP32_03910 [Candidatus Saccharimonadales bacterium]|nr:hypothetical protein [Candidatus Saccharimonadales bacterium]
MQPSEPNPDLNFILNNSPQSKRGLKLPSFNLPKPAKIIIAVVVVLLALVVISSILSSHKSSASQPYVNALARQQEILRVTQLTQQQLQLQDPSTQALAATTYTTLSSQRQQILKYLSGQHMKVSTQSLVTDQDKTTDSQLQTAAQNNNLDAAFATYLKQGLTTYQKDLQTAYQSAGPNGKKILSNAFDSSQILLSSAPLKS